MGEQTRFEQMAQASAKRPVASAVSMAGGGALLATIAPLLFNYLTAGQDRVDVLHASHVETLGEQLRKAETKRQECEARERELLRARAEESMAPELPSGTHWDPYE